MELAGKLLRKRLDPSQDAQLIQEAVAGLRKEGLRTWVLGLADGLWDFRSDSRHANLGTISRQ